MDLKQQSKRIHQQLDSNAEITTFAPVVRKVDPSVERSLELLWRDGYVIIHGLLDRAALEAVRGAVVGGPTGRNRFEGRSTQRLYGILGKSRVFDTLALQPTILALNDAVLQPNYLITASQAINILPGEPHQPYHFDDAFCLVPRPRQPFSTAVIYAIDDFTAENGATVIFPKSHLWGDRIPDPIHDKPIPAVMPAKLEAPYFSCQHYGMVVERTLPSLLVWLSHSNIVSRTYARRKINSFQSLGKWFPRWILV